MFYKAQQAPYKPNPDPFDGQSLAKTDYRHHKDASKAKAVKHDNDLFGTDEPLTKETTNLTHYKAYPFEKKNIKKEATVYRPPSGLMDMQKTSDDFKNFGKSAPPSKSLRPKTNINFGGSFDGVSSYKYGYVAHDMSPRQQPIIYRGQNFQPSDTPFDNVTEAQDKYKRYPTAPAHMVKRENQVFDGSVPLESDTSYGDHYTAKRLPECESNKILANNYKGYRYEDNFETGHRFLTKVDDSSRNNSANLRENSAPLPPIRQNTVFIDSILQAILLRQIPFIWLVYKV